MDHKNLPPLRMTDRKVRPIWCYSCHKKSPYQNKPNGFQCVNCGRKYVYK